MDKLCLLMALFIAALAHAEGRKDGAYLRDVTTSYETPHLNWAKPLDGGPIKVLIITPRTFGAREVVELSQRMDVDYEAVVTSTSQALAVDNVYEAGVLGTSAYEKALELSKKIEERYDVIVLANVDFGILPPEAQYKILNQVAEGAGLVLTYVRNFPYQKVMENPADGGPEILKMIDIGSLPLASAMLPGDKLLKTFLFGKGRVVVVDYGVSGSYHGLTSQEAVLPDGWKSRYENGMALIARTIQWAAGRDLSASIVAVFPENGLIAGEPGKFGLNIDGPVHNVNFRVRDRWNNVLLTDTIKPTESKSMTVSMPSLAAGEYYLDLLSETNGKISTFGVSRFDVKSSFGNFQIATDRSSFEQGETVEVVATLEKPMSADAELTVKLEDAPDRNVWKKKTVKVPAGTREVRVSLADANVPTIAAYVVADLKSEGVSVQKVDKVVYFPRRDIEIFPTILWDCIPRFLSEMYAGQLDLSFNDPAGLSHPGEGGAVGQGAALFNQRFVAYTTRIALEAGENGQTLSGRWLGMSDEEAKEATKGDGSFYNPAVRDFWKKSVERRLQGLPQIGPMIYTLGDENHFSYEAGYSEADNVAFPEFLEKSYHDIATLNKAWGSSYDDFQEIGHPTPQEMRQGEMFQVWNAHRRFMEKQYADVHHSLAQWIKEIDPHAKVGSEGSVPGDLELTISGLDFWGPYSDPVEDELLRSIAPEKLRTVWWNGDGRMAYPLWSPLLKGIVNGNAWYTSTIEPLAGFMAVDFNLSGFYREDRKPYVDALNRGTAQLLTETPLRNDGIAIFFSQASHSASFMDDRFWKQSDSMIPVMNFLYREGVNFDLLTSEKLLGGQLKNYKMLWLLGATAISEQEKSVIEAFVKQGGMVVADINPGILNDSCAPLEKSLLGPLFGVPELNWKPKIAMSSVDVRRKIRGQDIIFKAEKAYQSSEIPVFSVKEWGKGTAILLNFNLSSAVNTAVTPFDGFMMNLLAVAGVKPELRVEGVSKEQLLLRVRETNSMEVIGALVALDDIGKNMVIRLRKQAWVYEADKGLIGFIDEIRSKMDLPFKVFTVYPREQAPPDFTLANSTIVAGQSAKLDFSKLSQDGVYRLEVVGPEQNVLKRMGRVFSAKKPSGASEIKFAISDQSGSYEIGITDIGTGLKSSTKVNLTAAID